MNNNIFDEYGIIIILFLIAIPVIVASIILVIKANNVLRRYINKNKQEKFNNYLHNLSEKEIKLLKKRQKEIEFELTNNELRGNLNSNDNKGLLSNINKSEEIRFVEQKKKSQPRPYIEPKLTKLILWYLACATFWLVIGTTIGEYLGIKFVAPDLDHNSWLSFGRLRPVHTNMVFWGWASLAMIGLAYYVVPRVSNVDIASTKKGYQSLILINAAVFLGSISLMNGINNGGGEYREYVWPIMSLFGIGIVLTLINFWKTVAIKKTKEIYVSNWYIVASLMFVLVITFVAYWPSWQDGLGETIIQGYYMHQGVGMWFMLFSLGLMYYFLPQQLNKPIYSYSLGILAFWSQILFYTLIGTHHFIFSAIPWWMQTIAIVGSMGMIIPVVAGTTNFLMTINGSWGKLSTSYTLPFYVIGIIFYFTGSLQGTAEAFRFTNLIWHFTDFTVAHSHLTMYGIITFMLWAFIYTIVPRLTGNEPPQITVGAHFWLALLGLLFYTFPLMYGATMRGLLWLEGKPFIDTVSFMAPYWLWRAIGGSLMWLSHILFAYNFYKMVNPQNDYRIPTSPSEILKAKERKEYTVE
ncbi:MULTISPECIES: cbb3-type cytochrome c oxidase subunit I [unclassified Flavobacterium]|jgi:cytochrome c oxidase cbb3-type subunit 1|uniref:cbb3-type cytochrome c oxidase subunit I n=1 Tax=unclassified Flavobacterium TaxID=196869 RepID=UPI000EAB84E7|nr:MULTISPECIES: cbb3-type cytochrome c oxidase subunit I [unclassified Flavobacterium]RKS01650.1 cytochrome c oxidase cbb3-type subunit 1 [Flavobacterium sp. 102]